MLTLNKQDIIERIPNQWVNFKEFVANFNENCYFEASSDVLLISEVDYENRQFLIKIDLHREQITFVDDLICFDEEGDSLPKELIQELIDLASKYKMDFYNRGHGGNGDYLWYGLRVKAADFSEEKLLAFSKEWSAFNIKYSELKQVGGAAKKLDGWSKLDYDDGADVYYKIDNQDQSVTLKSVTVQEEKEITLFFDEFDEIYKDIKHKRKLNRGGK